MGQLLQSQALGKDPEFFAIGRADDFVELGPAQVFGSLLFDAAGQRSRFSAAALLLLELFRQRADSLLQLAIFPFGFAHLGIQQFQGDIRAGLSLLGSQLFADVF